jgi:hypothetical protein
MLVENCQAFCKAPDVNADRHIMKELELRITRRHPAWSRNTQALASPRWPRLIYLLCGLMVASYGRCSSIERQRRHVGDRLQVRKRRCSGQIHRRLGRGLADSVLLLSAWAAPRVLHMRMVAAGPAPGSPSLIIRPYTHRAWLCHHRWRIQLLLGPSRQHLCRSGLDLWVQAP